MYIHIGNNIICSDAKIIGVFNRDTLVKSGDNEWIIRQVPQDFKTVAVERNNSIVYSMVSPFTVIKRTGIDGGVVWRKRHE